MSITPEAANAAVESDAPEVLLPAVLSLYIGIDHGYLVGQIVGVRWDENMRLFVLKGAYKNTSTRAQLGDGRSQILFCGQVIFEFPPMQPFVIPAGEEFTCYWHFTMGTK